MLKCRREAALDAVLAGVRDVGPVYDELRQLTAKGLREALCGKARVSAEDLAGVLYAGEAQAHPRGRRSAEFLLELLGEWGGDTRRLFLQLLTGLEAMPLGGLRNPDAAPKVGGRLVEQSRSV